MGKLSYSIYKFTRKMGRLRLLLGALVIIVNISSLVGLHFAGFFLNYEDVCRHFYGMTNDSDRFHIKTMIESIGKVLEEMETLQLKLESDVLKMEKDEDLPSKSSISRPELKKYLQEEVVQLLYGARVSLRQIQLPTIKELRDIGFMESLINDFSIEEIKRYITPKENNNGNMNIFGIDRVYNTIGHACVSVKKEVEDYMDYDVGSYCKDDWNLAQKLMLHGCDPLPRRRCMTRSPALYLKPYPINESLWRIPNGRNVRWDNYECQDFGCLSSYENCIGCFEMEKEALKWVKNNNKSTIFPSLGDFLIDDALDVKPGEIRIGLDYSVSTGSFAARMMEHNVTIISVALNLGAPFNEMIALRGLVPLYITPNQRLPFFDNTLDLIHTSGVLGGWMDVLLFDFIVFDWDRVLRPGGLLWMDRFMCRRQDLDEYMYLFLQFRYKKHRWVVAPMLKGEVFLSALLEKPRRSV